MKLEDHRKHEVAFCSDISKWADRFFEDRPEIPLGSSDIESFGRGSQKRHDLRFYERTNDKGRRGRLALSAEVKLPGTAHGRSPFDPVLVQDAFDKADRAACRYFFTWNVEQLALFDRSLFNKPLYERCIGQWRLGIELKHPSDVERPDVKALLYNDFLPKFFLDFSEVYEGRRAGFAPPLSDLYITVLESHLSGPMGPVRELRDFLMMECDRSKPFESKFLRWLGQQQWNFNRKDAESWRETVDRAARSMAYVLSNRILFYQAVRLRYLLPDLDLPTKAKTPEKALEFLRSRFDQAVFQTGDYEPVFFPDGKEEWAAHTALSGVNSLDSWRRVIQAVEKFSFDQIPSDVLGGIFQKLISPEERHKFGQHYTDENIVDVINAFCIRQAESSVMDPACGSGGFLVRAYYRKAQLPGRPEHHELLEGLYGCDINPFPAHLATLNLAARNITQQENYPLVVRKNFFKVSAGAPFCEIPKATRGADGERERQEVFLPKLDAIVGNPPYVRQELIARAGQKGAVKDQTKEYILEVVERAWPGVNFSGQSDLHLYFWPVATQFLKEGGWFGFLTSSSWLDVRYGFALQRWLLLNFEIVAIIESTHEPWFEDARVKTAVTILRRCSDETQRNENLVRFVRVQRPVAARLRPGAGRGVAQVGRRDEEPRVGPRQRGRWALHADQRHHRRRGTDPRRAGRCGLERGALGRHDRRGVRRRRRQAELAFPQKLTSNSVRPVVCFPRTNFPRGDPMPERKASAEVRGPVTLHDLALTRLKTIFGTSAVADIGREPHARKVGGPSHVHDLAVARMRLLFPLVVRERAARLARCSRRACPFPAVGNTGLCRGHAADDSATYSLLPSALGNATIPQPAHAA